MVSNYTLGEKPQGVQRKMKKNRKQTRKTCAGCNKKFKNLNGGGLCAVCEVNEDFPEEMFVAQPRQNNRNTRTQTRLNKDMEKEGDLNHSHIDSETEKQKETDTEEDMEEGNKGEQMVTEDNGEKDELHQLLELYPKNTLISILKRVLNIVDGPGNDGKEDIREKRAIAVRGLNPESDVEYMEALKVILPSIQPEDIIQVERRGMETDGKTLNGVLIVEFVSEEIKVKCLKSKKKIENTKYRNLLITQALTRDQITYKKNLIQILKFTGMERTHRINGELKLVSKATTRPAGNSRHGPFGPGTRVKGTAPGEMGERRTYQRDGTRGEGTLHQTPGTPGPGTRDGGGPYQRQGMQGPGTRDGGGSDQRQGMQGPGTRDRGGPDRRQETTGTGSRGGGGSDQRQGTTGPRIGGGGGPDQRQGAPGPRTRGGAEGPEQRQGTPGRGTRGGAEGPDQRQGAPGPGTTGVCGPDQAGGAAGPGTRGHQNGPYNPYNIGPVPQPAGLGHAPQYQTPQYYMGPPFTGPYYSYTSVPSQHNGPTTVR